MRVALCAAALAAFAVAPLGCPSRGADAPAKRPNVVVFLADDLGFSDVAPYGSEIATPNLDALAAEGVRFTQFYSTGRCWPTRAALLTGYYPQQIRMDPPQGRIPAFATALPRRLQPLGYRSYHAGKWHVMGAPRPVADGGFDRSYWLEDTDRHFAPRAHFEDDAPLPPVARDAGYFATTAIADHAIGYLREHASQHAADPFFLYVAFTAPHFPLQAPPEDIAGQRDRYREGWDAVRAKRADRLREQEIVACEPPPIEAESAPRYVDPGLEDVIGPGEITRAVPWSDLTEAQQRFQAAKMEIHAAMVSGMDREIGRVLEQLRAMHAADDTVVFFLSDNGADASMLVRGDGHDPAAAPGSAASFLALGPGWAGAANAPFRGHKIGLHEGGIASPLVVRWPRGIAAHGALRRDAGHVVDLPPTILELAGGRPAEIGDDRSAPRLPGRSLVASFAADRGAPRTLYFAHEGSRALRDGDWKAVAAPENGGAWELFDLRTDRCERDDLAAAQPQRLRELEARWRALDADFTRWKDTP